MGSGSEAGFAAGSAAGSASDGDARDKARRQWEARAAVRSRQKQRQQQQRQRQRQRPGGAGTPDDGGESGGGGVGSSSTSAHGGMHRQTSYRSIYRRRYRHDLGNSDASSAGDSGGQDFDEDRATAVGAYGDKPGTRDAVSGRLAAIGPAWEGTEATGSSSEAGGCRARPPSSSFAVPVDLEELRALLGDPPPPAPAPAPAPSAGKKAEKKCLGGERDEDTVISAGLKNLKHVAELREGSQKDKEVGTAQEEEVPLPLSVPALIPVQTFSLAEEGPREGLSRDDDQDPVVSGGLRNLLRVARVREVASATEEGEMQSPPFSNPVANQPREATVKETGTHEGPEEAGTAAAKERQGGGGRERGGGWTVVSELTFDRTCASLAGEVEEVEEKRRLRAEEEERWEDPLSNPPDEPGWLPRFDVPPPSPKPAEEAQADILDEEDELEDASPSSSASVSSSSPRASLSPSAHGSDPLASKRRELKARTRDAEYQLKATRFAVKVKNEVVEKELLGEVHERMASLGLYDERSSQEIQEQAKQLLCQEVELRNNLGKIESERKVVERNLDACAETERALRASLDGLNGRRIELEAEARAEECRRKEQIEALLSKDASLQRQIHQLAAQVESAAMKSSGGEVDTNQIVMGAVESDGTNSLQTPGNMTLSSLLLDEQNAGKENLRNHRPRLVKRKPHQALKASQNLLDAIAESKAGVIPISVQNPKPRPSPERTTEAQAIINETEAMIHKFERQLARLETSKGADLEPTNRAEGVTQVNPVRPKENNKRDGVVEHGRAQRTANYAYDGGDHPTLIRMGSTVALDTLDDLEETIVAEVTDEFGDEIRTIEMVTDEQYQSKYGRMAGIRSKDVSREAQRSSPPRTLSRSKYLESLNTTCESWTPLRVKEVMRPSRCTPDRSIQENATVLVSDLKAFLDTEVPEIQESSTFISTQDQQSVSTMGSREPLLKRSKNKSNIKKKSDDKKIDRKKKNSSGGSCVPEAGTDKKLATDDCNTYIWNMIHCSIPEET